MKKFTANVSTRIIRTEGPNGRKKLISDCTITTREMMTLKKTDGTESIRFVNMTVGKRSIPGHWDSQTALQEFARFPDTFQPKKIAA